MKLRSFIANRIKRTSAVVVTVLGISAVAALFNWCPAGALARAASTADGFTENKIVATVGDHQITEKELDTRTRAQMAKLQTRVYELKKQTLESMADEYLVEQAAKKANLSPEDYLKKQLAGPDATEADAKKWYDEHKARLKNQTYDQIKDRLIAALNNRGQAERRQAMIERLRKDVAIKILLLAPRVTVVSDGHPEVGPENAPVTIVEFGDFQCPFCKRTEQTLKQLRAKYGDRIKLVYMDYPLPFHQHALDAAKAARCAGEQSKFWPYHDDLFADQSKLAPADLRADAKKLGLDTTKFDACFDNAKYEADVRRDMDQGGKLGVDGTPTFYIDGRLMDGAQPLEKFEDVIDDELAAKDGTKPASAR